MTALKRRLTGKTGNRIQDGTVRGAFTAAVMGILAVIADRTGALTDADLVNLFPAVTFVSWMVWAGYDAADDRASGDDA